MTPALMGLVVLGRVITLQEAGGLGVNFSSYLGVGEGYCFGWVKSCSEGEMAPEWSLLWRYPGEVIAE